MAEAKKTTKKTVAKKADLVQAEQTVSSVTTDKIKELVETEAIAEAIVEAKHQIDEEDVKTAKAGKRSAKAIAETEEKQKKVAKKTDAKTAEKESKPVAKARSRVERAGKKYQEVAKLVDSTKIYPLNEALDLVTKTNPAKFDASVEMHINLGVDPKQADQNVRDTVVLPAGTGKTLRVAVICEDADSTKATTAGADLANNEEIFAALDKETINFDVLISIPTMMAKLGKYARLLGPRGLMPNPKSGTVTTDVVTAIGDAKRGKVEYRVDQAGIIHLAIGKVSFTPEKLQQNADVVMASIRAAKPSSLKGIYIKSGYLTSSMGPSIKFEVSAS